MNSDNETQFGSNIPITQWAEEDRPREKMIAQGKKSLTDSELIAILLRTGVRGASAIDLAKQLLIRANGRLSNLSRLEVSELQSNICGLGEAKAVTVLAALELGNRMLRESKDAHEDIIKNSDDLFHYIAPTLIDLNNEEFWAVYLNNRNKVVSMRRISAGGYTETPVDIRQIFCYALESKAVAVAVAHNHPSGNLKPSQADKDLTKHIDDAGKILKIKLIEHLIVGIRPDGKPDYYSFSECGLL